MIVLLIGTFLHFTTNNTSVSKSVSSGIKGQQNVPEIKISNENSAQVLRSVMIQEVKILGLNKPTGYSL